MYQFKLNEKGLTIRRDEYGRLAATIRCSECGKTGSVPIKTAAHAVATEFINKKFRELKWEMGRDHHNDVCPQCVASRRKTKLVVVQSDDLDDQLDAILNRPNHDPEPNPEPVKEPTVQATTETTNETPRTRRALSRREEHTLINEVEKLIEKLGDGVCKYIDPSMTDGKVAELLQHIAPGINHNHIMHLRQDMFGRLPKPEAKETKALKPDRINALEKRMAELEAMVLELMSK